LRGRLGALHTLPVSDGIIRAVPSRSGARARAYRCTQRIAGSFLLPPLTNCAKEGGATPLPRAATFNFTDTATRCRFCTFSATTGVRMHSSLRCYSYSLFLIICVGCRLVQTASTYRYTLPLRTRYLTSNEQLRVGCLPVVGGTATTPTRAIYRSVLFPARPRCSRLWDTLYRTAFGCASPSHSFTGRRTFHYAGLPLDMPLCGPYRLIRTTSPASYALICAASADYAGYTLRACSDNMAPLARLTLLYQPVPVVFTTHTRAFPPPPDCARFYTHPTIPPAVPPLLPNKNSVG